MEVSAAPVVDLHHHTDRGNAERLVKRHGELIRYVEDWEAWLVWNTRFWERDPAGLRLVRMATDTCNQMIRDAAALKAGEQKSELIQHALKSENATRLREMVFAARDLVAIAAADLNRDEFLLNVQNGTIDLRTGELLAHDPGQHLTRCLSTPYNKKAECPRWERFIAEISPDPDQRRYLQKALGYTLTGSTREQCLFFMFGKGQNGKSTFINTIRALLEGYAEKAAIETFMEGDRRQSGSAATPDLADLVGARLVIPGEIAKGAKFNESRLKDMTGNDAIKCRRLHEAPFEFIPQFKLWLYGNHKPIIKSSDYGIRRRMRLIPFTVTLDAARRDDKLAEKLLAELPGILRWCVDGCLMWQAEGLDQPRSISQATGQYLDDMDILKPFLEACCYEGDGATVSRKRLWEAYQDFTRDYDEQFFDTATAFSREIGDKFDSRMGAQGVRYWLGLGLLVDRVPEDTPPTPRREELQESCHVEPTFVDVDLPDACVVCGAPVEHYSPAGLPLCANHTDTPPEPPTPQKTIVDAHSPYFLRRSFSPQKHDPYRLADLSDDQQKKWFCRSQDDALPPLEVRNSAWYALTQGIAKHFDLMLEKTPVETALALMSHTLPRRRDGSPYEYEPLEPELAELIRTNSTQHRMEAYRRSGDVVDLVELYDSRVAHAKYLRHLPVIVHDEQLGDLIHEDMRGRSLGREHIYTRGELSFRPGWYLVDFSIPADWNHIGLVPVPGEGFPRKPKASFTAWLHWREAALLKKYGWPYEVQERILFAMDGEHGTDPLRTFHDKMIGALERLEQLEKTDGVKATRSGLRAIVLHAIGNFARRRVDNPTKVATLDEALELGPEVERAPDGEYIARAPSKLTPYQQRWYKPEWAADIWAGTRAHTTERALTLPFEQLLAIDGDGIYSSCDPTLYPSIGRSVNLDEGLFVDRGKVGDYKRELELDWRDKPRKLPAQDVQLKWLRDVKKGIVR